METPPAVQPSQPAEAQRPALPAAQPATGGAAEPAPGRPLTPTPVHPMRRTAMQALLRRSAGVIRALLPRPGVVVVRCSRCDHPFASDTGLVEERFALCTGCAKQRLKVLLLLSIGFGVVFVLVMLFAPGSP